MSRTNGLRSDPIGRRHEFRTNRIPDRLLQNAVDIGHRSAVDMPAGDAGGRRELIGAARAPQCDIPFAAIEYPSHGEMNHAPAVMFLREPVQSLDRGKVLFEARRDKFRIVFAQVVAGEAARSGHAAG
jgi:hypothetical protein